MRPPERPANEAQRQAAVDEILLTHPELEKAFDLVTRVVVSRLDVAMSTFTLVDRERLYFASRQGLEAVEVHRDVAFCGHAILSERIYVVNDARAHPDFNDSPLVTGGPGMRFYAAAPVHAPNGHLVGALSAIDTRPRELTDAMAETLQDLRGIVESLLKLLALSVRDHLTGLSNRRHFDETLDQEWHRACRTRLPIALLSIDLDFFKTYNDTYGHLAGDECLRRFAEVLQVECKRSGDLPFRVGGEEFAVLLAMTTGEEGVVKFAEDLQQAFHRLALPHSRSRFKQVTASIGVAIAGSDDLPLNGKRLKKFIARSDEALYAAKKRGRDRIVVRHFSSTPAED